MNLKSFLLILALFPACGIFAQDITFSDPNFERAILEHDSIIDENLDNKIQMSEALGVRKLVLNHDGITSLKDVYHFPNLEYLNVSYNEITEVSLEGMNKLRKLYCSFGLKIQTISVRNMPELTDLAFSNNQVKLPVLENLPKLKSLYAFNNQIEWIDVSSFKNLKYLNLSDNSIGTLDISKNLELVQFHIDGNPLTEIDIRKNKKLKVHIIYVDEDDHVICTKNQETEHFGMTFFEMAPKVDDVKLIDREQTIDSLVLICKYEVVFELMKKELVDSFAIQKNWDEKRKAKVNSIIKFEDVIVDSSKDAFSAVKNSELISIIKECSSIDETQVKLYMKIHRTQILEDFENHIRRICELN